MARLLRALPPVLLLHAATAHASAQPQPHADGDTALKHLSRASTHSSKSRRLSATHSVVELVKFNATLASPSVLPAFRPLVSFSVTTTSNADLKQLRAAVALNLGINVASVVTSTAPSADGATWTQTQVTLDLGDANGTLSDAAYGAVEGWTRHDTSASELSATLNTTVAHVDEAGLGWLAQCSNDSSRIRDRLNHDFAHCLVAVVFSVGAFAVFDELVSIEHRPLFPKYVRHINLSSMLPSMRRRAGHCRSPAIKKTATACISSAVADCCQG